MPRPLFLLAHGAGASSASAWMVGWKERLGQLGAVATFDYPYMQVGRRTPDPLPKLIVAHRQALAEARRGQRGPVVLIGKSMGGRVGCHVALEEPVSGLVCLGYPLKGMGKSGKLRDEVLLSLRTPILFVQGTRDSLCPLDLLRGVQEKMQAPHELHIVESGDHSLLATKAHLRSAGEAQSDVDVRILQSIARFAASLKR